MAEKALTTYDDDIMDAMPKVLMVMMGMMLLVAVVPATQYVQAQAYAQAYQGVTDPRTIHITNILSWINLVQDYPFTPWISAYFINDGPSPVEVGINYPSDTFTMEVDETITVTRSGAQERIKIIFFRCFPGLKATMRVTGTF